MLELSVATLRKKNAWSRQIFVLGKTIHSRPHAFLAAFFRIALLFFYSEVLSVAQCKCDQCFAFIGLEGRRYIKAGLNVFFRLQLVKFDTLWHLGAFNNVSGNYSLSRTVFRIWLRHSGAVL